jgi:small subunit ribosomal protein S23
MARGRTCINPNVPLLTYNSVVQRQLWLMERGGLSENEAYDKARKEFYALRHEEEVERRVAKEEATWTGAYFGKSSLEVGMELEDKIYEEWKEWASKEIEGLARQRDGAYTGAEDEDVPDVDASSVAEAEAGVEI